MVSATAARRASRSVSATSMSAAVMAGKFRASHGRRYVTKAARLSPALDARYSVIGAVRRTALVTVAA